MAIWTPAPRHVVLAVFLLSALYVHLRGRVRFGLVRALTDFTVLLAPYNALMYAFSKVRTSAFVDPAQFPELSSLAAHWREMREEAARLNDEGFIRAAAGYNDMGFNSFFRTGWKRFYLKWYGEDLPSAQRMCPRTAELLNAVPSVKAAMFASLPPGARLVRHRDPYAGSLRYHLGLITPNSEQCYIVVDGERYFWRDGEAMMFDETYIHHAENTTQMPRVILFCDVERPLKSRAMTAINRWFARNVMKASATQNVEGEKIGALNRMFGGFYQFRLRAKELKSRSRAGYYVLKWALLGGLFYLLFV
ncbi:MAG TPA: aspartyl/asparaginyl beta-hydroxylase domain-containing protein [Burkholderiaceae bacterium]|jgi:beta-hydroxylase|nr:aspartyl/asparaginyl beta-hydroxylase domain-containing protein [Burkholderiaceae bacterium]